MAMLIEANPGRAERPAPRTVSIAGVSWPVHKLHAVLAAAAIGLMLLVVTRSAEITAWGAAATLLAVWWGEPHLSGNSATEPRSNPLGIS